MIDFKNEIPRAYERIKAHVRRTPFDYSLALSEASGAEVYLKLENIQYTGSFKLRGAMNKLLTMTGSEHARGVITASSGNHGAALALGMSRLGIKGCIYVPEQAARTKTDAIRRLGAEVIYHGRDGIETERYARQVAENENKPYISPYNDPAIVAGQGTAGYEIFEQQPDLDALFISIGGGGLISGAGGYLRACRPGIEVVGCSPENSAVMMASIAAGRILDLPSLPTLSDGTAGGIEADAITFAMVRHIVTEHVAVSEAEIRAAMLRIITDDHLLIEGAAGVAVAGLLKLAQRFQGKKVAVLLCGGNISAETLKAVLNG